jgi:hypothetical protein
MVISMTDNDMGFIRLWISCHGDKMDEIQANVDKVAGFLIGLAENTLT